VALTRAPQNKGENQDISLETTVTLSMAGHSAAFRGRQGARTQGLPPHRGPTKFMCFAICTICACHLVIFVSEESLFVDAIKLSVVQTSAFHLNIA